MTRGIMPNGAWSIQKPTDASWTMEKHTATPWVRRIQSFTTSKQQPDTEHTTRRCARIQTLGGRESIRRFHIERWRQDPDNRARIHAARDRFRDARMEDERYKFYLRLKNWCYKYSWVREQLPWKSYQPVLYDNKVEHHCDGCNWTRLGGKKLWWKKIETSPAADSCSWLCFHCYIPKTNWAEALPQGYEDLGMTTVKEIIKRRDSLGHGG